MGNAVKCLGSMCSAWISKENNPYQTDGKHFCSQRCMDEYSEDFAKRTKPPPAEQTSPEMARIYMAIFFILFTWVLCPHGTILKVAAVFNYTPIEPTNDERFAGGFIIFMMLVGISSFFYKKNTGVPNTWKENAFMWTGILAGLKVGLYIFMGWLGATSS